MNDDDAMKRSERYWRRMMILDLALLAVVALSNVGLLAIRVWEYVR